MNVALELSFLKRKLNASITAMARTRITIKITSITEAADIFLLGFLERDITNLLNGRDPAAAFGTYRSAAHKIVS